jgi:hypothetical protein
MASSVTETRRPIGATYASAALQLRSYAVLHLGFRGGIHRAEIAFIQSISWTGATSPGAAAACQSSFIAFDFHRPTVEAAVATMTRVDHDGRRTIP